MSDKTCPYCYPDTAGNHQDCCPNYPPVDPKVVYFLDNIRAAHTADDALERRKMLAELANEVAFKFQVSNQRMLDFIRNWTPKGETR